MTHSAWPRGGGGGGGGRLQGRRRGPPPSCERRQDVRERRDGPPAHVGDQRVSTATAGSSFLQPSRSDEHAPHLAQRSTGE